MTLTFIRTRHVFVSLTLKQKKAEISYIPRGQEAAEYNRKMVLLQKHLSLLQCIFNYIQGHFILWRVRCTITTQLQCLFSLVLGQELPITKPQNNCDFV